MNEKEKLRTSKLAISSLIFGILFFLPLVGWLLGIIAIICGICALRAISKYKNELKGKGLAITGMILGGLYIIAVLLGALVAVIITPILELFK